MGGGGEGGARGGGGGGRGNEKSRGGKQKRREKSVSCCVVFFLTPTFFPSSEQETIFEPKKARVFSVFSLFPRSLSQRRGKSAPSCKSGKQRQGGKQKNSLSPHSLLLPAALSPLSLYSSGARSANTALRLLSGLLLGSGGVEGFFAVAAAAALLVLFFFLMMTTTLGEAAMATEAAAAAAAAAAFKGRPVTGRRFGRAERKKKVEGRESGREREREREKRKRRKKVTSASSPAAVVDQRCRRARRRRSRSPPPRTAPRPPRIPSPVLSSFLFGGGVGTGRGGLQLRRWRRRERRRGVAVFGPGRRRRRRCPFPCFCFCSSFSFVGFGFPLARGSERERPAGLFSFFILIYERRPSEKGGEEEEGEEEESWDFFPALFDPPTPPFSSFGPLYLSPLRHTHLLLLLLPSLETLESLFGGNAMPHAVQHRRGAVLGRHSVPLGGSFFVCLFSGVGKSQKQNEDLMREKKKRRPSLHLSAERNVGTFLQTREKEEAPSLSLSLSHTHTQTRTRTSPLPTMATCGFCGGTASACGGALGPMIEVAAPPPPIDVDRDNVVVPLIALSAPDVVHRHCALWSGEVRKQQQQAISAVAAGVEHDGEREQRERKMGEGPPRGSPTAFVFRRSFSSSSCSTSASLRLSLSLLSSLCRPTKPSTAPLSASAPPSAAPAPSAAQPAAAAGPPSAAASRSAAPRTTSPAPPPLRAPLLALPLLLLLPLPAAASSPRGSRWRARRTLGGSPRRSPQRGSGRWRRRRARGGSREAAAAATTTRT